MTKAATIVWIKGKCTYEGCGEKATHIAQGRQCKDAELGHPYLALYCLTHARMVADEQNPEYTESCPNCGCMFGVN